MGGLRGRARVEVRVIRVAWLMPSVLMGVEKGSLTRPTQNMQSGLDEQQRMLEVHVTIFVP